MGRRNYAIVTRDKQYLYVRKTGEKKTYIRFNLERNTLQKYYPERGVWEDREHVYSDFLYTHTRKIFCTEQKFAEMIQASQSLNHKCKNVSTFIKRLSKQVVMEEYVQQGVKFKRPGWTYGITRRLSDYDKNTRKLVVKYELEFNNPFEHIYFANPLKVSAWMQKIDLCDELTHAQKKKFLYELVDSNGNSSQIASLCGEYSYDVVALANYVLNYLGDFEALGVSESLRLLDDYYRMAQDIGRNVDKYPKYLKSVHDIIAANHRVAKKDYDLAKFESMITDRFDWEDEQLGFTVFSPRSPSDVVEEGVKLSHCVSSYVQGILDGKRYIVFLRKLDDPDSPLYTVSCFGGVVREAKGAYNQSIRSDAKAFQALKRWSKKVGVTIDRT